MTNRLQMMLDGFQSKTDRQDITGDFSDADIWQPYIGVSGAVD